MSRQVKCKKCEEWQEARYVSNAKCIYCGAWLFPQIRQKEIRERKLAKIKPMLLTVNPTDKWYQVIYKYLFNIVQIIFVSIVSFVMWIIATLAG